MLVLTGPSCMVYGGIFQIHGTVMFGHLAKCENSEILIVVMEDEDGEDTVTERVYIIKSRD